jgi:hypothetical protein
MQLHSLYPTFKVEPPMTGKLDPDLAKLLREAGVDPDKATDRQIALADKILADNTGGHGVFNWTGAIDAMRRHAHG